MERPRGNPLTIGNFRVARRPWFVAQQAGVLLYRAVRDLRGNARRVPAPAAIQRCPQLLPVTLAELWAAKRLTHCSRPLKTGFRALTDLLSLQLGERGQRRQQNVADEFIVGRQVLLCEAVKADTMLSQPLQVYDRRRHALAAEAVERPYEQQVEFTSGGVGEHR
jgi:hypothetical protein